MGYRWCADIVHMVYIWRTHGVHLAIIWYWMYIWRTHGVHLAIIWYWSLASTSLVSEPERSAFLMSFPQAPQDSFVGGRRRIGCQPAARPVGPLTINWHK